MTKTNLPSNYKEILLDLKKRIHNARYESLNAVNKELIQLYWDIGKKLYEQKEWGKSVVDNLSHDLQCTFPGIKGFSSFNLWRMSKFYRTYFKNKKLAAMLQEITWTHNVEIIKCKSSKARQFYIENSIRFGWSYRLLSHHIQNNLYNNTLSSQNNFQKVLPKRQSDIAKRNIRDDYTFDFLNASERYLERELENVLIQNICDFLKELGGYFSFIDRQYHIEVDNESHFVDLLFYNRELKSLVALELKTGKFKPEYASKMNFYLSALDDKVKLPQENPSIGMIICKTKGKTTVEYTLKDMKKPIGIATYNHYRTLSKLPKRISEFLPSQEEIKESLMKN